MPCCARRRRGRPRLRSARGRPQRSTRTRRRRGARRPHALGRRRRCPAARPRPPWSCPARRRAAGSGSNPRVHVAPPSRRVLQSPRWVGARLHCHGRMKTPFRAPALCTCEMLVCPLLKPTCSGPRRPGGWARGRHRRARPAAAAWPAAARARARPAWRRARRAWACRRARAPPRAPPPSARQATCWVRARGVRPQGHPQGHPASARGSLPWAHGPPGARAWACRERRALPGGRGRAWQCPLARCCASRREAAAKQPHCWVYTCFGSCCRVGTLRFATARPKNRP